MTNNEQSAITTVKVIVFMLTYVAVFTFGRHSAYMKDTLEGGFWAFAVLIALVGILAGAIRWEDN